MGDLKRHTSELMMIGNNIAFYRRKKQLSQIQLAEKVGISRTHISNIEAPNVLQAFSIGVLLDIANSLEVEPMKLFDFSR